MRRIRSGAWAALYLVAVSGLIYGLFSGWAYDDPFISYRYAENLAAGRGFVYNPGERVLSTTTALMVFMLAGLSYLCDNLPNWANLIGAISLAAGALCLWDLARSWNAPAAGWLALAAYPTLPLLVSTLGSETLLYLALGLGTFAAYARRRYTWVAVLGALATLARPDAILIPILLAADWLWQTIGPRLRGLPESGADQGALKDTRWDFKTMPWQAGLVFAGLLMPWIGFAWWYFGSPIPATLATKQMQGMLPISQRYLAGLPRLLSNYAAHPIYWLMALLALVGIWQVFRGNRRWWVLLAWPVAHSLAYILLGISRYNWYYAPPVVGLVVASGLGLDRLAQSDTRLAGRKRWWWMATGLVCLIVLIGQIRLVWQLHSFPDARVGIFTAVGDWLQLNTPLDARVGVLEVGIIGYEARRAMIDFTGLLQPEVARQLSLGTYEAAAYWAIDTYRPEYLVLQYGSFFALNIDRLPPECRVVQVFRGLDYNYPLDMTVYQCR